MSIQSTLMHHLVKTSDGPASGRAQGGKDNVELFVIRLANNLPLHPCVGYAAWSEQASNWFFGAIFIGIIVSIVMRFMQPVIEVVECIVVKVMIAFDSYRI